MMIRKLLLRPLIILLAPFVVVSVDLLVNHWWPHRSGNHDTTPAFLIGIALGGLFVLRLPFPWLMRVVALLIYIPLAWALLIPYSLWFIGTFFNGMVSGG